MFILLMGLKEVGAGRGVAKGRYATTRIRLTTVRFTGRMAIVVAPFRLHPLLFVYADCTRFGMPFVI